MCHGETGLHQADAEKVSACVVRVETQSMTITEKIRRDINVIENATNDSLRENSSYLISFRIIDNNSMDYHRIYHILMSEIKNIDPIPYHHTTSTYIVRSDLEITDITKRLKPHIRPDDHLIVLKIPTDTVTFVGPAADFTSLKAYIPSILHI